MAFLEADVEKIISTGVELKDISRELSLLTNDLYDKLIGVSVNGVWTSGSADGSASLFVQGVTKDRAVVKSYETSLKSLGEQLVFHGKQLSNISNNKM